MCHKWSLVKTLLFVSFNSGSQKASVLFLETRSQSYLTLLWYSHAFQYRQNHFDALEHRRKPQSTYWYRVVGLTLRCYRYWNILATNLQHDQKPISHFYVAVVTCVLARFSWTAVRAKALQIAKQDEKEPATFPTPYAISSLKEKKMKKLTRHQVSRLSMTASLRVIWLCVCIRCHNMGQLFVFALVHRAFDLACHLQHLFSFL